MKIIQSLQVIMLHAIIVSPLLPKQVDLVVVVVVVIVLPTVVITESIAEV